MVSFENQMLPLKRDSLTRNLWCFVKCLGYRDRELVLQFTICHKRAKVLLYDFYELPSLLYKFGLLIGRNLLRHAPLLTSYCSSRWTIPLKKPNFSWDIASLNVDKRKGLWWRRIRITYMYCTKNLNTLKLGILLKNCTVYKPISPRTCRCYFPLCYLVPLLYTMYTVCN